MINDRLFDRDEVAVVCGGPSLKDFDWSRLEGRSVIAVNRAWEVLPEADVIFSIDNRLYDRIKGVPAFRTHPGRKVWLDRVGFQYERGVDRVRCVEGLPRLGPSCHLERGISHGENSGFAAMCLAIACGAERVYMLGLDMNDDGGWWHDGYPNGWGPDAAKMQIFRSYFEWAATFERIRDLVVNCNPESGVRGFSFGELPW